MTSSLAARLGDIPGVASVSIDLEGFGRGIDVRLEPGADELAVMEKLRALLAAYGVKHDRQARASAVSRPGLAATVGVDVAISPVESGARIEVATQNVRSFRIVAANPVSIAQGLADAWCQVIGRIPIEIVEIEVDPEDRLTVVAFDGEHESRGSAPIDGGWLDALTRAVGEVIGESGVPGLKRAAS